MKSTALALYWIAITIGQYAGTLMVAMVHKYTVNGSGRNWLPDRNLNRDAAKSGEDRDLELVVDKMVVDVTNGDDGNERKEVKSTQ
ncbi:hypothetical protein L6452_05626 [Arctium lappa]|uniref:Uncharacterized protein n=1 Tax=Arctium lappa TaxID=4217 RepID=A0ACB9EGC1_ARCLA|nr:hypothetical protein L6452_05626 [Arctium lappa]